MANANMNWRALQPGSEAVLQLWRRGAAQTMAAKGETNPLAQLSSWKEMTGDIGMGMGMSGLFGSTPITIAALPAAKITMFHDLRDQIQMVENANPGTDRTQSAKRVPLTLSCGNVKQADGFPVQERYQDAQQVVGSIVNMGHRLGKVASASQAEYMLAALYGMRGIGGRYETHEDMVDANGATFAQMASSAFMQKLNTLHTTPGSVLGEEQKVRALTENFYSGNMQWKPAPLDSAFDTAIDVAYAANQEMQWENFVDFGTALDVGGNLGNRDFPFKPGKLSGIKGEGGKRMYSEEANIVLLTNTRVTGQLRKQTDWLQSQRAASGATGRSGPLWNGHVGMMHGGTVVGFDKCPIYSRGTGGNQKYYAVSLALGVGALVVLQGQLRDKAGRDFSHFRHQTTKKFMESNLPVDCVYYPTSPRRETHAVSIEYDFGCIRPSFPDKNDRRTDVGVWAIHSQLDPSKF
ncbi:MAG: hypothetical protein ACR2PR_06115 [Pseudohongiellaceae bacterium]